MKKLLILLFLFVILSISFIRVTPKFNLIKDQFAFWGCTGDFWVEVNEFYEEKSVTEIDPKYWAFSKAFYPVRFAYPPLWIVTVVSLKNLVHLSNWIIGKLFIYSLGIIGSFTLYFLVKKITGKVELGILSALVLNLAPYYVIWTGIIRFMIFALPLIPLSLYFLTEAAEKKNKIYIIISGIFGGGVLLTHHFSFWPLASTLTVLILFYFFYMVFKKDFSKIYYMITPLAVLLISLMFAFLFSIKYPFFQNISQSGWLENSLRTGNQYIRLLSPLLIVLFPIGILTSIWKIKNNKKLSYTFSVLYIWLFATWLGLESARFDFIFKKYIPLGSTLILNVLTPQTSSRFFVHFAQPVAVFSILGLLGIWKIFGKLIKNSNLKKGFFLILLLILFLPSLFHSYQVSKNYIGTGPTKNAWKMINFICDKLPEESVVLSDIAIGESIIQKCNKQFLAYYTYAKNPFYVYKIRRYILTEKNPEKVVLVAKKYGITHILVDKYQNFIKHGNKEIRTVSKKFETEYFDKIYEEDNLILYKISENYSKILDNYDFEKIENEIKTL